MKLIEQYYIYPFPDCFLLISTDLFEYQQEIVSILLDPDSKDVSFDFNVWCEENNVPAYLMTGKINWIIERVKE
jgi:hypothetical protein